MAIQKIKLRLNNAVQEYAIHIKNKVENRFNLSKPEIKDYPAMVSVCSTRQSNANIYQNYSHTPIEQYIVPSLRTLLNNQLGKIGEKSTIPNCKNIVGQCAEVHAANRLLKDNRNYNIQNIVFSVPIRPRTGEFKDYCGNCKQIFNL